MDNGTATNGNETGTTVFNRPHQPAIHYSARGYDEFRADLSGRLEEQGFVLREEDFLDAFIDLTAYLGEVLMTYQNAYAQEVYLETAQLRESLFNLAAMVDYRVNPGAGATGTLAVLAKPGKAGLLPKGFQVSGKAEGAKEAVYFETDAQLAVDSRFNDFSLARSEQYKPIVFGSSDTKWTLTVKKQLTVNTGQYVYGATDSIKLFAQVQSAKGDETSKSTILALAKIYPSSTPFSVSVGSATWYLLPDEPRGVVRLTNATDKKSATIWLDNKYGAISAGAPLVIKESGKSDAYGVVSQLASQVVTVKTGVLRWISQNPADKNAGEEPLYDYTIQVQENGTTSKTFYALEKDITETREVTQLTVNWEGTAAADYVPSRSPFEKSAAHTLFVGIQEQLEVQGEEADPSTVRGVAALKVDGDFTAMEKYRQLLFHEVVSGVETLEAALVLSVSLTGSGGTAKTLIQLVNPLSRDFTKYGVKIWGNVAKASQGKSLPATTLGSGRGDTPYQAFKLPQAPLTYERQAEGTIMGAISLTVEDLPWEQHEDFRTSGPEDRHFVVETGFDGASRVLCGDGVNGARLPTGRDNVAARYRIGQGSEGNVPARVLKKPTAKPAFLKEVFNPETTAGGADPDKESGLRSKIPTEHLTFDRAVSLRDYADLALAYPGVGKAKSGWRWRHGRQYVVLAVYGEHGQDLTSILGDLRAYLDARRDINQPLLVQEVAMVAVRLTIRVATLPGYDAEKVKDAITTSVGTGVNDDGTLQFFNPDRLDIGMSIHAKEVYRLLEQVPGVGRIRELTMERCPPTADGDGVLLPAFCPGDVWIHSWELAELDAARLDVEVEQPPTKAVCERSGG